MIPSLFLEPGFLEGWVRHKRYKPRPHQYKVKNTWVCINANELESFGGNLPYWKLNAFGLHTLSRDAFLGHPGESIRQSVTNVLLEHDLPAPEGQILAIAACKNLGIKMNPASFYLIHDLEANLVAIIVELKNSSGEAYPYIFKVEDQNNLRFRCEKAFYIGNHTPMDAIYFWDFYIGKRHFMVNLRVEKPDDPNAPRINPLLFPAKVKQDALAKIIIDITFSTTLKPFNEENAKTLGLKYAMKSIAVFFSRTWTKLVLNENGLGRKHPRHYGEEHPRQVPPPQTWRKTRRF